jgi:hypothetical protein
VLGCDEQWLRVFRVLTREDLKVSTEILRPNVPGSSSVRLSWIWQTGRWYLFRRDPDAEPDADADARPVAVDEDAYAEADPATLLECS